MQNLGQRPVQQALFPTFAGLHLLAGGLTKLLSARDRSGYTQTALIRSIPGGSFALYTDGSYQGRILLPGASLVRSLPSGLRKAGPFRSGVRLRGEALRGRNPFCPREPRTRLPLPHPFALGPLWIGRLPQKGLSRPQCPIFR